MGDYTKKENVGIMEQTDVPEQGVFFRNKIYGSDKKFFRILTEPSATQCNHCKQMQGVVLYGSEAELKSSLPPYHPNCRCSYEELDEDRAEMVINETIKGIVPSLLFIDPLQSKLTKIGLRPNSIDLKEIAALQKKGVTIFRPNRQIYNMLTNERLFQFDMHPYKGQANYPHINVNAGKNSTKFQKAIASKLDHTKIPKIVYNNFENLSSVEKAAKIGGKTLAVVGIAMDVYEISSAIYYDLNDGDEQLGKRTVASVVGVAGGWGGAAVGAKLGAMGGAAIGSVFPGLGTAIGGAAGGVIGGILGAWGGSALGAQIVDQTYQEE